MPVRRWPTGSLANELLQNRDGEGISLIRSIAGDFDYTLEESLVIPAGDYYLERYDAAIIVEDELSTTQGDDLISATTSIEDGASFSGSYEVSGIRNLGTINTGAGNDVVSGIVHKGSISESYRGFFAGIVNYGSR